MAPLAKHPGVDTESGPAQIGDRFGVRWCLEVGSRFGKFLFTDLVSPAVRVIVKDGWQASRRVFWLREDRRDYFTAIDVELKFFENVTVFFLLILFTLE